ncbi:MAG: LAGLIDADG family homing endonuclease [archaeon]|nr:LAGLIDADG family homing endonuclease [archaeon]MCP8320131.1 LAGLIDADG family homing endonuclease [archaeon]
MREVEVGYLAGLIVGEGHIIPEKIKIRRIRGKVYYARFPRIEISSTDKDTLEKAREIVGAGSIRTLKYPPPRLPLHRLTIDRKRAYKILEKVFPYVTGTKKYKGIRYPTADLCKKVLTDPDYKSGRFAIIHP